MKVSLRITALSAPAFPETPLLSDLALEEGLAQARAGDTRAADTLESIFASLSQAPAPE